MGQGESGIKVQSITTNGIFYSNRKEKNNYSPELQKCIESEVKKLRESITTYDKPGMLLGKIQGGKTTTYIGIIALAFDNNYDIAIVLTKGTKALAKQTLKRFNEEFEHFIKREDNLEIYDIMFLPPRLTRYQLNKKLIFIVKKEDDNLNRLSKTFFEDYPDLYKKQILIIDDEADYASVGFKKTKEEGLKINVISKQISDFRTKLSSFLQVTATPYSLYLQPPDYNTKSILFKPLKPSFTELVPIHDKYVGSETYFGESSDDDTNIAHYLFIEVPEKELEVLGKQDLRYISNIDSTPNLRVFRDAILNFIVGGCIRRLQNKHHREPLKKFSFVVHTETSKAKHEWQYNLIEALISNIENSLIKDIPTLKNLIKDSYENLLISLKIIHEYTPSFEEVFKEVQNAIKNEYIGLYKVNSDSEIETLLDDTGQLKLSNPLNIFIGGQILDRGITIENLIGFFYGRNPQRFQQDTVIQHSRMYGARPKVDLSVTRFYTSRKIYTAMKKMHEFDSALREAFEKGNNNNGVIFIQEENNTIIPCSPNKILLSNITTIKPGKRLLPVGFQTLHKKELSKIIDPLDNLIDSHLDKSNLDKPILIDIGLAENIIKRIADSLIFEDGYEWDLKAFISSMQFLSKKSPNTSLKGKIYVIVRKKRKINRKDNSKPPKFEDAPDTPKGEKGELRVAREIAKDIPCLILLRQIGSIDEGWNGGPFWWPVLVAPQNITPVIFSSEVEK